MKYIFLIVLLTCLSLTSCDRKKVDTPGILVHPTTDQDAKLPRLVVNGIPLHLETYGDPCNPILICLHGGPGFDYKAMISESGIENASAYPDERLRSNLGLTRLADEYYLVFYDRRGSGLSPRFGAGKVTMEDQINDLDVIVDHFRSEQAGSCSQNREVGLFGWSFGGYLATAYANQYPEKIRDLALYEPRPFNNGLFDMLTLTSPMQQLGEDYVDEVFSGNTYVINNDHETMDYQWAVGATGDFFPEFHNPADLPFWRVGFRVNQEIDIDVRKRDFDVTSGLGAFAGNTLLLFGELSARDAASTEYIEALGAYFPRYESTLIEDAGHFGPWDNPIDVVDALRNFFN